MSEQKQTLTIQQAIDLGLERYNAGHLPDAVSIFQQILQTKPNQPVALNLLGVIFGKLGNHDGGVDLITKALTVRPDYADAHNNIGTIFMDLGKLNDAVASFQNALAIKPDYADAHYNLGLTFWKQGKMDDAVASYHKTLSISPAYVMAHVGIGNIFMDLGKENDGAASFQNALTIKPDFAEALNNLGNALLSMGKTDDAVASFQNALAIKPDYADAHYNLHAFLLDQENMDPSIECMEKAVEISPERTDFRFTLGMLLDYSGNSMEAKPHFDVVENDANIDSAKLEAWRYIKSACKKMPLIVGSNIQAYKLGIKAADINGLVLEFGVRFGTSIRLIAELVKQEIHGFDSFEGLPEAWHDNPKGSYSTGKIIPSVQANVTLHAGWFEDTLPGFIKEYQEPVRFLNIDCDIYSSTKTILELLAKQIIPGTVIVFDEYIGNKHWREDEFKAFQEAVLKYGWKYEYLCFSFVTKQVVIRIN